MATELSETHGLRLLDDLRGLGLVAEQSKHDPDEFDAHPLVREHFGARLKAERPEAWRAGNGRLYEHLRDSAKPLPDTLAEMAPLFQAMYHGCQAGRHQEGYDEVCRPRVTRGSQHYQIQNLGAFGADLAAIADFFEELRRQPAANLVEGAQAWLLNQAASDLRGLGRLREAVAPMFAALGHTVAQKDWANSAIAASNLSELSLSLGDVHVAVKWGEAAVAYADQTANTFIRLGSRTYLADALHQVGNPGRSEALFEDPRLYSLQGYRFCDLLAQSCPPRCARGRRRH